VIAHSALDLIFRDIFFEVDSFVPGVNVILKLEGFHITGSIKIKTAIALIDDAEVRGNAIPGKTKIIESSSGNLGVALAFVCSLRGYSFVCVTDPKATQASLRAIQAYGGELIVVTDTDENGGYVGTRMAVIKEILASDPNVLWVNQYANPANKKAHFNQTAQEILKQYPNPDWLFVGVGTSGTFMGCAEHFKMHSPKTRVVAVDYAGSVTFGDKPRPRHVPGIGNSRRPELVDPALADQILLIDEFDAIRICREMVLKYGLLLGGSSGAALAAVRAVSQEFNPGDVAIVIAPDFGDKYLDTVYNDHWVLSKFGRLPFTTDNTLTSDVLESYAK